MPIMHSLEAACNEAQNLIERVIFHGTGAGCSSKPIQPVPGPSWINHQSPQPPGFETQRKGRVFNIHQRLRELYLEECRNAQPTQSLPLKNLKRGSRLLEKLVQRENLNTLIVNLYPGNKGYSLSLRLQGKVPAALGSQAGRSQGLEPLVETMRWPYSDEELLRCIDNEEIPPTLVDLLETNHSELFYQGCVVAEIRDYRLTFPLFNFETHHVLLKPTTQSIINDVNLISSSQDLSAEDRLSLESQMVLATAPPLCLDPNPAIGILLNNLHHRRQRLSTAPLRRTARKFSQVTVNRKRKLDQFTSHNTLLLHDFITRRKAKLRTTNQGKQAKKTNDGVLPTPPPVPSEESPPLAPPSSEPDVLKYAKHYEKARETTDCTAHLIEEYVLETERGQGRIYHITLTILQRYSNSEYLGELYVDRDYKEGERNGASCRFVLGTRAHANRYIQQFTEIFTEEGRKSVRITHVIPGQQHRVSFTPGMRERNALAQQERTPQAQTQPAPQTKIPAVTPATPNPHLQHILPNPHQISLSNLQIANFNLQQQKTPSATPIQISSVSHLTSLLTNSTGPPNVNVHQIQQTQNVIGLTQQNLNLGLSGGNLSNSAIQSLLTNALTEGSVTNLQNGPVSTGTAVAQSLINSTTSNATVHHQPLPSQVQTTVPVTKPSRPPISANPAISALVTSLMNSAQQFQVQQAAAQAASSGGASQTAPSPAAAPAPAPAPTPPASSTNQNPTILSLLNATTPLSLNNSNVISTSHVNLSQQNQKLLARKTTLNLLNHRLLNQNISAALNSSVSNPTLVVNNANPQQLRVAISSLTNHLVASNQTGSGQNPTPQILNIGSVNPTNSTSGFTIAATQANLTQASSLTSQTFTISNANPQTFTITTPNPAQNQTYSITAPAIGNLTQAQSQTFTLTPNTGSFTISPANTSSIASSGFTITPAQSSTSQPQTFTVLQPNQNLGNQSFTITTPVVSVGNQSFTVTNAQQSVGNQAFTITNSNVQNQTFQINNAGSTNQTFTITTPVVTVASQFVNCQSPASSQAYPINAPSPQTNTFTVNSPVPNQVFAVNIPSPAASQNQSKSNTTQGSVVINKNQTFTINANNQNFTVTTPIISNSSGNGNGSAGARSAGRIAACQRRLSNALQQTSELNKLLNERTDASKHFSEKSEGSRLSQALSEKKIGESKLSQALTDTSGHSSSSSNLGLSMPGLSALLAGTPSADNPIPGASNSNSLLERLASSAPAFASPPPAAFPPPSPAPSPSLSSLQNSFSGTSPSQAFNSNSPVPNLTSPSVPNFTSPSPKSQVQFQGTSPNPKEGIGIASPLSSPPGSGPVSLNLQGLGLQGIPGLQNVQVSIPGLAVPISLSLNVSGPQTVQMTQHPLAATTNTTTTTSPATMVLTNSASGSGNVLSLPVTQLVTSGVKNTNQRATSISLAQGTAQSIQLVTPLQRPSRPVANQIQAAKSIQPIASRGIVTAQRQGAMKATANSQLGGTMANTTLSSQVLTLAAQQQLQLALQKQAQLQSIQCLTQQNQKRPLSPSSIANTHRRRSNAADPNK